MIDAGQYGQKSQNTNSCDMDLSCPVTFLRMPASEVIMYSTSKKRVLLAIISTRLQINYFGERISDRKFQAKLWYVICTFQIWCFPSSQDGVMDCCAEAFFLTRKENEWYQQLRDNTCSIEEKTCL
jgi:hypothetical protein